MTTTEADRAGLSGRVIQVPLPPDARRLSTLSRVDYEDAFIVDAAGQRTAEQWARAVFNDAPLGVRARLVSGWLGLGLNLRGPWSARRVLGWKVQQSSPSVMLLAAARALWVRITSTHQKVVRSLLEHAARRAAGRIGDFDPGVR